MMRRIHVIIHLLSRYGVPGIERVEIMLLLAIRIWIGAKKRICIKLKSWMSMTWMLMILNHLKVKNQKIRTTLIWQGMQLSVNWINWRLTKHRKDLPWVTALLSKAKARYRCGSVLSVIHTMSSVTRWNAPTSKSAKWIWDSSTILHNVWWKWILTSWARSEARERKTSRRRSPLLRMTGSVTNAKPRIAGLQVTWTPACASSAELKMRLLSIRPSLQLMINIEKMKDSISITSSSKTKTKTNLCQTQWNRSRTKYLRWTIRLTRDQLNKTEWVGKEVQPVVLTATTRKWAVPNQARWEVTRKWRPRVRTSSNSSISTICTHSSRLLHYNNKNSSDKMRKILKTIMVARCRIARSVTLQFSTRMDISAGNALTR